MKADITMNQFSHIVLIYFLIATLCKCIGEAKMKTSDEKVLYDVKHNTSLPVNINQTNITQITKDFWYGNGTVEKPSEVKVTIAEEKIIDNAYNDSDDTPLPIPIMVASPAVAVGIFIFICVACKWHTVQLDAQAKELATQITSGECPRPCIPCSPCHNTHRLLPPSNAMNSASQFHSDTDLLAARRKSLQTYSSILLTPPGIGNYRGSSWSAISDQEVLSHSPHRHSTFLL